MTSTGAQAEKPPVPPGQAKKVGAPVVEESTSGSYIVVLAGEPLVAEFGQDGLGTPAARARGSELVAEQNQLMAEVGVPATAKLASYENAMNGFAAIMSFEQAQALSEKSGVASVFPNELQQPTTDASGDFLGLSGDTGVWATEATGDGVLVGIIDSGIWPEHPSLDPAGFTGSAPYGLLGDVTVDGVTYPGCEFGTTEHALAEGFADPGFTCNEKLIGARQVMPAYEALTGLTAVEYGSARDEDGHGTHTATTAAGNAEVPATVLGVDRGTVTGIAPGAQVVAYKALGTLGGYGSDLALAIDIAVLDGVDVINYSIGSSSFAIGPDDLAFLSATLAGVHVATSNGNSGPGAATIGSPASIPWLTSVGASTHDRSFIGSVTVSSDKKAKTDPPTPVTVPGVSITGGTELLPIVDAADLGNEECLSDVKFKGSVKGKIVLCKRGTNARIDKSYAVYINGGAGMVLYNTFDADTQITDSHWVPSVHTNFTDGSAVKQYIATAKKPVAQITGGEEAATQGSVMAAFSSRGPNRLSADLIKPDVTAPGVNILAGQTPTPTSGPPGNFFQSISGTSMSSPHVAGLMALMAESHPLWSPSMVKSSLMTTARQDVTKEDGATPADPFDMGAGHVQPTSMFAPGLVYDVGDLFGEAGLYEYAAFTCGAELGVYAAGTCAALDSLGIPSDPSELNLASIGIDAVPGSQTVTRTVTSVAAATTRFSVSVDAPEGFEISVSPSSFELAPGASASFEVTVTNVSAPLGEWRHGSLTWSDEGGAYRVYSPISVNSAKVGIPDSVAGSGESGSASFGVAFGYSGDYSAAPHGLEPATVISDTVVQDPDQVFDPADGVSNMHQFALSGAALLRLAIPPEATEDGADLDIFLYNPSGELVATSTNGGTDELIDVVLPADGTWTLYVQGWQAPGGDSDYDLFSWIVSATPGGNLTIDSAPTEAVIGATGVVDVSWTGATAGEWHLGAVSHSDGAGLLGLTLIEVDNR